MYGLESELCFRVIGLIALDFGLGYLQVLFLVYILLFKIGSPNVDMLK